MKRIAVALTLLATLACPAVGQQSYTPSPENLKAREWFQDARFGMFIHWGCSSVLEDGEWVMNNQKIPVAEYEKIAPRFNPTEFNADEVVGLAKRAGMKYITLITKHHDGFALWATKQTDWNVVDRTPYKKDIVKMFADACQKQGIKLFFYHSHLDWHHPDYYPLGRTGHTAGRPEGGNWNKYLDFMDAQLTELLTNYGPIGGIWFDGWWDKPDADWRLDKTYSLIHKLQPACLVGNNHHVAVKPGEDFQMFEKDLPGENKAGFNKESKIGQVPLETCETISGAWGYNKNDKNYKSAKDLLHYLVRAAGHNANFLLNIGPMPSGKVQPEFVERLNAIGAWMQKNGESIYGTRGGPIAPRTWGATTQKGDKVYVHILNLQDSLLAIPLKEKVASAKLLATGEKVTVTTIPGGLALTLPEKQDELDTVVELTVKE